MVVQIKALEIEFYLGYCKECKQYDLILSFNDLCTECYKNRKSMVISKPKVADSFNKPKGG